jgi:hypothetical protein
VLHPRSALAAVALAGVALALSACQSPPVEPSSTPTGDAHGEIAGAVELAEPPLGLTTVSEDGAVSHLDLIEETTTVLDAVDPPRAVHTDGRFVFADVAAGVEIVDSGVWTWDHVDHFHYYRAEARAVGLVPGAGPAAVATTLSSTSGSTGVAFAGSEEAVLLDTAALADGRVEERFRLDVPGVRLVVPVGTDALIATDEGVLTVVSAEGSALAETACAEPRGTITTRVGAVIGCADGAVLATTADDGTHLEHIDYPAAASAPPAAAFAGREGRPTVAARAGDDGIWLLDTRERSWRLLSTPMPLIRVAAVDDADENVLGVSADGRVVVIDGRSGEVRAQTEPLVPSSVSTATLVVDQQRAYLNAAAERRLYEIDFADDARIARVFDTDAEPLFLAGTGR